MFTFTLILSFSKIIGISGLFCHYSSKLFKKYMYSWKNQKSFANLKLFNENLDLANIKAPSKIKIRGNPRDTNKTNVN